MAVTMISMIGSETVLPMFVQNLLNKRIRLRTHFITWRNRDGYHVNDFRSNV